MTILLTGFNPFGELKANPSELIVEELDKRAKLSGRWQLASAILKTEYVAAENAIRQLLRDIRPQAWLGLGVAGGTNRIQLERVALNLDDTDAPDNAGESRSNQPIISGAVDVYRSSLPLRQMRDALESRSIPVSYSNHAGTYICNHVFYIAMHEIQQLPQPAKGGFMHVPQTAGDAEMGCSSGLSLLTMIEAVECCLDIVQDHITGLTAAGSAVQSYK